MLLGLCIMIRLDQLLILKSGQGLHKSQGHSRNLKKGFPLQLSDCYIRVVYIA